MLQAGTAYRSLLWRLVENLELLTVIEKRTSFNDRCPSRHAHIEASRLPSDSRVPKSSSVPARLCTSPRPHSSNCISHTRSLRRSRIPQLCSRPQRARSSGATSAYSRTSSFASAIDDLDEPGLLPVSRGERLRIMMSRGPLVRCCRVRPRHDRVFQGLMPTSNLAIY